MGNLKKDSNNFWSGKTKSFIETIFGGKTIEEIKSMSIEDRKSLLIKKETPTTGHTSSMSGRTSFDVPKRMSNDKHRSVSLSGKTTSNVKPKSAPEPLRIKPSNLKKEAHEYRKSTPTKYSGSTSNNIKSLNTLSFNNNINSNPNSVAGTVDYSFPAGVNFIGSIYGFDGEVYAIEIQKDGKILVGGDFGTYYSYDYPEGYSAAYLIRLNSDGTVDDTFSTGNINGDVFTIAIQPDGKILLGGNFGYYDGLNPNNIIRINPDGSPDYSFVYGSGFNAPVNVITLQSDGKILVGGIFGQYNSNTAYYLIRLNSNGSIDNSFVYGNDVVSFNGAVNDIKVQSDGKILVVGEFSTYAENSSNYIIRLNSDGTRDTTFVIGTGFSNIVYSIDLQSDGKIIVGGDFYDYGYYNGNLCNSIVRLNTDGSLDSTFGYGVYGGVYKVKVQSDDKILIGGYFYDYYPYFNDWTSFNVDKLIRFNPDTTFDYNFYYKDIINYDTYAINLQSDGKILVGGSFYNDGDASTYPLNRFGRLNNTISLYKYVYSILSDCYENPKTYSMGSNTLLTEDDYYNECVVSATELGGASNTITGYIILDGDNPLFTKSKPDCEFVKKYNSCSESILDNYKYVVAYSLLENEWDYFTVDSRYEVGDIFFINEKFEADEFEVRSCFRITEIITNDYGNYYQPIKYIPYKTCEECVRANGVPYRLYSYTNDSTQKVISYQYFNYDGYVNDFFVKTSFLLTPSSYDYINFVSDSPAFPNMYEYGLVPKIYSTVSIDSNNNFFGTAAELMSKKGSGEYDYRFNPYYGSYQGFNDYVFSTYELKNGQILVGGTFDYYNNEPLNSYGIAKLNVDGLLDNKFQPNLFGVNSIYTFAEQSDGKILIGGNFEGAGNLESYYLVRVDKNGILDSEFTNNIMKDGGLDGSVHKIVILPSGKILLAGEFYQLGNEVVYGFVMLNSDGTINQKFLQTKVQPDWYSYEICLDSNGKILLGGGFQYVYNPKEDSNYEITSIIRLNSDGSLDTDFSFGAGLYNDEFETFVTRIVKDNNGKILVSGAFNYYNGDYVGFGLVRINPDGTWDDSLSIGNGFNYQPVYSVVVQPDDKIIAGGFFSYYAAYDGYNAPYIFRLNNDGTPDLTFFPVKFGSGFNDPVTTLNTSKDGELIVGGFFTSYLWFAFGSDGAVVKLFIANDYDSYDFNTCSTSESSLIYLPSSVNTSDDFLKGNVNNSPSVCGQYGNVVSGSSVESGSNYFSGDDYLVVSDSTDEDFLLADEDFTIEWYQNYNYDGQSPIVFSKGVENDVDIMFSIENGNRIYLWIKNYYYDFGYFYGLDYWNHFAITRNNNIIRLFKNGTELKAIGSSNDNFWAGQDILFQGSLVSTGYPLIIGNAGSSSSNRQYYGAITNFRWIKGTCLYDANFDVSTSPLKNLPNTKLLLLSKNETDLLLDSSSENKTVTQGGSGPTDWSDDSPFVGGNALYSLFNSDATITYSSCNSCSETEYLNVTTFAFNGVKSVVESTQMKWSTIQNVLLNGPYFNTTMAGEVSPYIYGIMNYYR
jgi:hypothetical protein